MVLIALGGVFLLQNAGLVLLGNRRALFILIPALAFASAWTLYQQDKHLKRP